MKKFFVFAICCLSMNAYAKEIYVAHCMYGGCPTGAPEENDLVIREIYALSNNGKTKFADWVAYRVTRETIGSSNSLERLWKNDDLLHPDNTLEGEKKDSKQGKDDYKLANKKIGTDRGHQAPLAAFAGTHFWRATNFISNITPQKSGLNQGPWKRLEEAVRDAAYELGDVYVVTGPLFDPDGNQMNLPKADEEHRVPTGYFKVIAYKIGKKLVALIFDQNAEKNMNYCEGIVSLTEVESNSGLTIFPLATDLSDDLRSNLGCSVSD